MSALVRPEYSRFQARRGRWMARVCAVLAVLIFGGLAVAVPQSGARGWGLVDSILLAGLGVLLAAVMLRFARVQARVEVQTLVVCNLFVTRRLPWVAISGVRFGPGDPWAVLELQDGDELAVMAIQRADGAPARAEAARLQALCQVGAGGPLPGAG